MNSALASQGRAPVIEPLIFWGVLVPLIYFVVALSPLRELFLANDALHTAGLFTDFWRHLNHRGEILWWSLDAQTGFPTYFNLLSLQGGKGLVFSLFSLGVAGLGWLGVLIEDFNRLYILFGLFVVPVCLALAAHYLARQLFTSAAARLYVAMLAGLSPAALAGLSEQFLTEPAIIGMALIAAWLAFIAHGGRRRFFLLIFWIAAFGYGLGFPSLQGGLILVPVAALWPFSCAPRRRRIAARLGAVSRGDWLIAAGLIALAVWPSLMVMGEVALVERSTIGAMGYDSPFHKSFYPGNPLDLLNASIPFGTLVGREGLPFAPDAEGNYLAFNYLGLLGLPLAVAGILFGRPALRMPLFVMGLAATLFLVMNNAHPFPAALLSLPTPLRANRHWSDYFFLVAGCLPLLFAGAAGLEALVRDRGGARRWLPWLAGVMGIVALAILMSRFSSPNPWRAMPHGFTLATAVLLVLALIMIRRGPVRPGARIVLLLGLILGDVAGVVFWQINFQILPAHQRRLQFGSPPQELLADFGANRHFTLTAAADLKWRGMAVDRLPWLGFYGAAQPRALIDIDEINQAAADGPGRRLSLAIKDARRAEFSPFLRAGPDQRPDDDARIGVTRMSGNVLEVDIETSRAGLFFWRDGFHYGWRAQVDGRPLPIARAMGAFKAVAVPAGVSTVRFDFFPTGLAIGLTLAHLALAGALLLAFGLEVGPGRALRERWS